MCRRCLQRMARQARDPDVERMARDESGIEGAAQKLGSATESEG